MGKRVLCGGHEVEGKHSQVPQQLRWTEGLAEQPHEAIRETHDALAIYRTPLCVPLQQQSVAGIERVRARGAGVVIAVGAPVHRAALAARVDDDRAVTLVHPGASIGSRTVIAAGSVVCAGALVSTNVRIGRHGHLNPGAIVGHDSILADVVSVNPGAVVSGDVRIDAQVLVGANAVVLQGLHIGEGTTIGAAACVTKDAPPRVTLVGVPARVHETTGKSQSS